MTLMSMAKFASDRMQSESAESIYLNNYRDIKAKDITLIDNKTIFVTTTSIIKDRSILGEKWTQMHFTFEYDVNHKDAIIRMHNQGYYEFRERGVSYYDFIKIKSIGLEVYKFFANEARVNFKVISRLLDLDDYDDVSRIQSVYRRKIYTHEDKIKSIEHYTQDLEFDKREYERALLKQSHWKEVVDNILNRPESEEPEKINFYFAVMKFIKIIKEYEGKEKYYEVSFEVVEGSVEEEYDVFNFLISLGGEETILVKEQHRIPLWEEIPYPKIPLGNKVLFWTTYEFNSEHTITITLKNPWSDSDDDIESDKLNV